MCDCDKSKTVKLRKTSLRAADILKQTPEERTISDAIRKVENLGADPLLTDCVVLLDEAREKLSQWVDEKRTKQ